MTTDSRFNPRVVEIEGAPIMKNRSDVNSDQAASILDANWARSAFLISNKAFANNIDIMNRFYSTADAKYTDTRAGCNISINPRPQFTHYCDPPSKGRIADRSEPSITNVKGNMGMGDYYSEAIDDTAQRIFMRFGVPQFNSITNFMSRAFNGREAYIARTGRAPGVLYNLGAAVGAVGALRAFPAIAITLMLGKVIDSFATRPVSKFYTIKPTMHTYWTTVDNLVNAFCIDNGIYPKVFENNDTQRTQQPFKIDTDMMATLSNLMPDVFKAENRVDVLALASKGQRLANQTFMDDFDKMETSSAKSMYGYLYKENTTDGNTGRRMNFMDPVNNFQMEAIKDLAAGTSMTTMLKRVITLDYFKPGDNEDNGYPNINEENGEITNNRDVGIEYDPKSNNKNNSTTTPTWAQQLGDHFNAGMRDGSEFVGFAVTHTGSRSESFGNSIGESDISSKLNRKSNEIREARFTFADGNLVGGAVGNFVGKVLEGAKDVATGALSGFTMGFSDFLLGLAGSGYIDIPHTWQGSNADISKASYKIQLISPYGNKVSQLINIWIPLFCLMAGALPRSIGKSAYTAPFLCQVFDRGRTQIRLGMIESLTITRGTSNLAFNQTGNALALEVDFTVRDMSSIMHMPVTTGVLDGILLSMDEDNILADYMSVLAGKDIYSAIYPLSRLQINLSKRAQIAKRLTSPAYWGSILADTIPAEIGKIFLPGSHAIMEGSQRQ